MSYPIVLISGGTSGIGKVTSKLLAAKGAIVIVSGRRTVEGIQVVEEIRAVGGQSRFIRCDICDENAVRTMIESIVAEYGRLDWMVNCAAMSSEPKLLVDLDIEAVQTMLDINIMGTLRLMKYGIRQMQLQGGGAMVNVSSVAGLKGSPMLAAYSATKAAVVGLTKSAAIEYAAQNIRINAVAPGAVRTEVLEELFVTKQLDEAMLAAAHPIKRIGESNEIANGIAWLLSDQASFITGHVLAIDGGLQA